MRRNDRQNVHQHPAQPKNRNRNAQQNEAHRYDVERAAMPNRGEYAGRDAADDRDEHCPKRQLKRRRKVLAQLLGDRLGIGNRNAQVAVRDLAQIRRQLDVPRLVQTEFSGQARDFLGRRMFAQAQLDRVAGDSVHEQKTRDGYREQHENQPDNAIDDEGDHPLSQQRAQ